MCVGTNRWSNVGHQRGWVDHYCRVYNSLEHGSLLGGRTKNVLGVGRLESIPENSDLEHSSSKKKR